MMNSKNGVIFDVKRFAIHDGDGIRTTLFLKGCPLRCPWCHNPEGRDLETRLLWFSSLCINCGICEKTCEHDAIKASSSGVKIDHEKCTRCGMCCEACPALALKIDGEKLSVDDAVKELEKDSCFFNSSDGGITLSGGEPLFQPEFCLDILKKCRQSGVNTAVETCLYASKSVLAQVLKYVDKIFVDIKIFDDDKHKKIIGVSNKIILENFEQVVKSGVEFCVRIPLIPKFTDDDENIRQIAEYVFSVAGNCEVELLNYNPLAESKYRTLGEKYIIGSKIAPLTANTMKEKRKIVRQIMEAKG